MRDRSDEDSEKLWCTRIPKMKLWRCGCGAAYAEESAAWDCAQCRRELCDEGYICRNVWELN